MVLDRVLDRVPDANWCWIVPDMVLDGVRHKKGAGQHEREQKNDIFTYNFLNNGLILINLFCLKAPDLLFQMVACNTM